MSINLIPSLEFSNRFYESDSVVYILGDEHCSVLNSSGEYKIIKYDVGAYFINVLDDVPVIYFGTDHQSYNKSYHLNHQYKLVEKPELLARESEGFNIIISNDFDITLIENDDYDIYWQVINKKTQEERIFNYDGYAAKHNGRLYVKESRQIIALSDDLSERWRVECKSSSSTGFQRSRFFADKYFIYVSFREEPSSRKPWPGDTVNLVCLDSGNTLWSHTFDNPVMSVMHHENSIIVGTDVNGFILDAASGAITLQFASPYNIMDMETLFSETGGFLGQARSESRLWTDGYYLYFTGNGGNQLHIYQMDGRLFSGPHQLKKGYQFDAAKECFHLNGKSYIPIYSDDQAFNLVDSGVMVIDPKTLTSDCTIEIEKGPEREVLHHVIDKKAEYYQLVIHADEHSNNRVDDLIRFAEIDTKRIAARYGSQIWTNKEKNRKFNGQIQLTIHGSTAMKLACEPMLDMLVDRVSHWAKESSTASGNRKAHIKVSWEWIVSPSD
jgi:hypothetical protein